MRRIGLLLLLASSLLSAKVVVFWQDGFPTVESQPVSREALSRALESMGPVTYAGLDQAGEWKGADLLVLPYGSAVPVDGWRAILAHLQAGGNLLVVGGRPFFVPVVREGGRFVAQRPQNAYSRQFGMMHTYEAPQTDRAKFVWDEPWSNQAPVAVRARRVWVASGRDDFRGMGFFENAKGEKVAAAVTRIDHMNVSSPMLGARCVFLNFDPEPGYWESSDGVKLLQQSASVAAAGASMLWVEMQSGSVLAGEAPVAIVHASSPKREGAVEIELFLVRDGKVIARRKAAPETTVAFDAGLAPGLYAVEARWKEIYRTGFWVRDEKLLKSGPMMTAEGDYFRKGGAPFAPFGTNYFSTDYYPARFGNGGNAYVWDRDFAEMAAHGVTFVRTGIWGGNADFVIRTTGGVDERFLRSLEAFVLSAGRHGIQVHFTFFAFDPQTIRRYPGQQPFQFGPGVNPYTDPVAVRAEQQYVASVVRRFRDVPYLSWDLINEPSYSNPRRMFRQAPNGDATEAAAWNEWLQKQYGSVEKLADAWGVAAGELGAFGRIPLPAEADLGLQRYGSSTLVRAVDFNLFAQDRFNAWVGKMIEAIRGAGGKQLVTVGQDEGGVTGRVLNQFYGGSGVGFTVNHTWWQDDALLWGSVVAKRPGMPNLIGETGVQPVWRMDGTMRWDEVESLGLFERKMALGLAAANSGSLQWDWGRSENFGIKRGDGANKLLVDVVARMGEFAKRAAPFMTKVRTPETAILLPQSLQLSVFNRYALEAQQKSVRALYHYARASAYVVGEYQTELLGDPKLIILPSPWVLRDAAWEAVLGKVRAGATLLLTGRFDLDEHFRARGRAADLGLDYRADLLKTRENLVRWAGRETNVSFSGDKCTYLERGVLAGGETFVDKPLGKGRVLYFTLPLEFSDDLRALGEVYRYALDAAKVRAAYSTEVKDPGVLICPTELEAATLYVLTSESAAPQEVSFRDAATGKAFAAKLEPGRAALMLVKRDGTVAARY